MRGHGVCARQTRDITPGARREGEHASQCEARECIESVRLESVRADDKWDIAVECWSWCKFIEQVSRCYQAFGVQPRGHYEIDHRGSLDASFVVLRVSRRPNAPAAHG